MEVESGRAVWFIGRSISDYRNFEGKIASLIKRRPITKKAVMTKNGLPEVIANDFAKIGKDDKIVFYVPDEGLIIGIFKVVSEKMKEYKLHGPEPEYMVHDVERIDDMIPKGKCLNFWGFIKSDNGKNFKTFPDVSSLDKNFQPKTQKKGYKRINDDDKDFSVLIRLCKNSKYLVDFDSSTNAVSENVYCALLEFYSTKSSSFVNMFLAIFFGLVTYSAFVYVDAQQNLMYLTLILFASLAVALGYTLNRYCYYAKIGEYLQRTLFNNTNFPAKTQKKQSEFKYADLLRSYTKIGVLQLIRENYRLHIFFAIALIFLFLLSYSKYLFQSPQVELLWCLS